MCGFVLAYAFDKSIEIAQARFREVTRSIQSRGPDDEGFDFRDRLALGFRRLSIIDLSESSHQPMHSLDGRYSILFNGEIFNYLELRRELERRGVRFRSTGDTEVLLNAFAAWGLDCVSRLNGMWAFLIVDHHTGSIHGSRDRFGIKPVYYARGKHGIVFASEIKAILSSGVVSGRPKDAVLSRWLFENRLEQDGETFIEGVERVPAGSNFTLHPDGRLVLSRYWNLEQQVAATSQTAVDLPMAFGELFENSVQLTLRSDVPVGVNLSGGLDSTAIYCAAARLLSGERDNMLAFSFLPEEFGEAPLARETVFESGGRLVPLDLSPDRYWDTLPALLSSQDEPVHSMTAAVGYHLYALARAHGVPVVLIGQGADETIGGYPSYFRDHWYSLLMRGKLDRLLKELASYGTFHGNGRASLLAPLLIHAIKSEFRRFRLYRKLAANQRMKALAHATWINRDLLAAITRPGDFPPSDLPGSLRFSVESSPLPLYLRVEDRNSMAHSVEARLPFLDHRLVTLALSAGDHWHISGAHNKFLLRESMRGRIPESVRSRVEKLGFPTPFSQWLRGSMGDRARELIADSVDTIAPYVDVMRILALIERHKEGTADFSSTIFACSQLALWLSLMKSRSRESGAPLFHRAAP